MSNEMNELFAGSTQTATSTNGGTLAGTQQLTSTASVIADSVMVQANSDIETYASMIKESQSDASVLDKLVAATYDIDTVSVDFLKSLDEDTLDGMLKSQQSKRSRCKSKEMTLDNYKSMLTAAIAERLIRMAIGKDKSAYVGRAAGDVSYTDERLAALASDQDALRKEIRNVQSKKSIMKSKAGFDETSDRWQALLVAENQLKSIRSDAPVALRVVDPLRVQLTELLAEVDEQVMSARQLKELVASIKVFVWPVEEEDLVDNITEDQAL